MSSGEWDVFYSTWAWNVDCGWVAWYGVDMKTQAAVSERTTDGRVLPDARAICAAGRMDGRELTEEERLAVNEELRIVMDRISDEAERNGLTDEVLEELLNED